MAVKSTLPKSLKPFRFHGLRIDYEEGVSDVYVDCPFCDGHNKFSINVETGKWRCFVCNEGKENEKVIKGGNVYTFLRRLHQLSMETTKKHNLLELRDHRKLLKASTLTRWGVCQSLITGDWLLPGYSVEGKLNQLYRYVYSMQDERWLLLATTTLDYCLIGVDRFDKKRQTVFLMEGPWDAMAFEEVARASRLSKGSVVHSANSKDTLASYCNILAVPGAMTFFHNWAPLFSDKVVNVCFDSDVPRVHKATGRMIPSTGYEATKRVSILLAQSESPPAEIHHLKWGENGFDPTLSSGYDVRDGLSESKTTDGRIKLLSDLLKKIEPMPEEWLEGRTKEEIEKGGTQLELLPCHKWKDLIPVWRKAMKWTEGLDRGLSVVLACVTSTKAVGDQLWIKLLGPPSSGKTSLVEAVAASKKYVLSKSTIRGFHSGFRSKDGSESDNSLIAQLFNKTLITKDGDSLLTSPNLPMILAEARDLYDGSTSASYRTGQNNVYEGLRITWVLCGTSSLRKLDKSELGERFLDCVVMEGIDDVLEDEVLWRVVNKSNRDMNFESNGETKTQRNPEYVKAMQMTGGYVEYLRANAHDLLKKVKFPDEMLRRCMILAKFVSYVRAKPPGKHAEKSEREFSPRLGSQIVRLAKCLAVVLNRKEVDEEVMSRTAKVACDTARGNSLEVIKRLAKGKPLNDRSLALSVGMGKQDMDLLLSFLCGIEVCRRVENKGVTRFMLTDKMKRLFEVTRQLVQEYEGVLK